MQRFVALWVTVWTHVTLAFGHDDTTGHKGLVVCVEVSLLLSCSWYSGNPWAGLAVPFSLGFLFPLLPLSFDALRWALRGAVSQEPWEPERSVKDIF